MRQRVRLLEDRRTAETDEHTRRLLEERIRHLETMWREARDLAVLAVPAGVLEGISQRVDGM